MIDDNIQIFKNNYNNGGHVGREDAKCKNMKKNKGIKINL